MGTNTPPRSKFAAAADEVRCRRNAAAGLNALDSCRSCRPRILRFSIATHTWTRFLKRTKTAARTALSVARRGHVRAVVIAAKPQRLPRRNAGNNNSISPGYRVRWSETLDPVVTQSSYYRVCVCVVYIRFSNYFYFRK